MQRRDAMKWLLAGGLGGSGLVVVPAAQAQAGGYAGKVLIDVFIPGGLDQSSWADPRENDEKINDYARLRIPANVTGAIRSAPMRTLDTFFGKYYRQMLVVNGIDCQTNDHIHGMLQAATGSLAPGYPSMSELYARTYGSGLALKWLNQSSLSVTANQGLAIATPIPTANDFRLMTQPNAATSTADRMKASDLTLVQQARIDRANRRQAAGGLLPRTAHFNQQVADSGAARATFASVSALLPGTLDAGFEDAHLGLICVKAGVTSAVHLTTAPNVDAHNALTLGYNGSGNNIGCLAGITNLVDYVWTKAAAMGIANRLFMRIYSEFGRTALNTMAGKDHHPIGCATFMEAAPAWGNRVFGASDAKHEALKINPRTGAVDPNGVNMTMRHVVAAMEKYLGIDNTGSPWPLSVPSSEMVSLFDPNARTGYPYT